MWDLTEALGFRVSGLVFRPPSGFLNRHTGLIKPFEGLGRWFWSFGLRAKGFRQKHVPHFFDMTSISDLHPQRLSSHGLSNPKPWTMDPVYPCIWLCKSSVQAMATLSLATFQAHLISGPWLPSARMRTLWLSRNSALKP